MNFAFRKTMNCFSALTLVVPALAAPTVPTPRLAETNLRIPASTGSASASLVLVVDGPDAQSLANDQIVTAVTDLAAAAPSPPVIAFGAPVALPPEANQRRWVLPFTVKQMPAGAELTRYVSMKIGAADWTLPYLLTSAAPTSTWKLSPLPAQARIIDHEGTVPLSISIEGRLPILGLKMLPTEFIDHATMGRLADGQLALCATPAPCAGDGIPLAAPGGQVWLAPRKSSDGTVKQPLLWPGKYEGSVLLASDDNAAGETANLTIYVSNLWWKVVGVFCILGGVYAAFYFTTFLRQRIARSQLMVVPVELRAAIDALTQALGKLTIMATAPKIVRKLREIDAALTDAQLERQGLPGVVPLPWTSQAMRPGLEAFGTYVEGQSAWLDALKSMVHDGLLGLVAIREAHEKTAEGKLSEEMTKAFTEAWNQIDQLASAATMPDAATLSATIGTALANFRTALQPPKAVSPTAPIQPIALAYRRAALPVETRSPEQIRTSISLDSKHGWYFICAVTTLAGSYVLIVDNFGFGTPRDLIGCLLWGLGLPVSTLLASSTTSSIATTLNVAR